LGGVGAEGLQSIHTIKKKCNLFRAPTFGNVPPKFHCRGASAPPKKILALALIVTSGSVKLRFGVFDTNFEGLGVLGRQISDSLASKKTPQKKI
jgi:hypothetical protein